MNDQEYAYLRKHILSSTGIDIDSYKSLQMRRRLTSLIENTTQSDVIGYCRELEKESDTLKKLRNFLTINVTEFFRDEGVFVELKKRILTNIISNTRRLKIWSAGCSNGAEAYTISMILADYPEIVSYSILGTDIDELSLGIARAGGPYTADLVKNVPAACMNNHFVCKGGKYWVKAELKANTTFKPHNLLSDFFVKDFDMILCRNVTIYFTDEAKEKLNRGFNDSLKANGILFIGSTEFMSHPEAVGFKKLSPCFYQKIPVAVGARA
jgi:chemotaxis protein methyltransferase CheR